MPRIPWLTVITILILLTRLIIAVPVMTPEFVEHQDDQHDEDTKKVEKSQVVDPVNQAMGTANKQIKGMNHCLDNPNEPGCAKNLEASFGKPGTYDMNKVKQVVKGIDGPVKINKKVDDLNPTIATADTEHHKSIKIGENFSKLSQKEQAGALIHEATHLKGTSDSFKPGKSGKPGEFIDRPTEVKMNKAEEDAKKASMDKVGEHRTSYYTNAPTTPGKKGKTTPTPSEVEGLHQGSDFVKDRKEGTNAENNADSYRIFGSLCEKYGRRSVHEFRRALLQATPEQRDHLLKRQAACKVPLKKSGKASTSSAGKSETPPAKPPKPEALKGKPIKKSSQPGASTRKHTPPAKPPKPAALSTKSTGTKHKGS